MPSRLTPWMPYLQPEVDITVSVDSPLLNATQLKECNLMSVTVESLFSPPEAFTLVGPQFIYTATHPMQLTAEVCTENSLLSLTDSYCS